MLSINNLKLLLIIISIVTLQTTIAIANTRQCTQLIVAGAEQWRPFAYTEMATESVNTESLNTEPVNKGVAHDIIDIIGKELNIAIQRLPGTPWKRIEIELEKGQIDILAGNYWTKERAKKWLITDAIASESVNLFTLADQTFEYSSLSDLDGKRGVVPMGISLGYDFDQKRKELDIMEVRTHSQMYDMLRLGRVDYLVSPRYAAKTYLKRKENASITMLPNAINTYQVHLSMSRQSRCIHLLPDINRIINEKIQDGSLKEIMSRYLKGDGG